MSIDDITKCTETNQIEISVHERILFTIKSKWRRIFYADNQLHTYTAYSDDLYNQRNFFFFFLIKFGKIQSRLRSMFILLCWFTVSIIFLINFFFANGTRYFRSVSCLICTHEIKFQWFIYFIEKPRNYTFKTFNNNKKNMNDFKILKR